jgi:hypothetical protein
VVRLLSWWSDPQDLRCSFVACFTDFSRPLCGAHDFGCAQRGTLDSTRGSENLPAPILASRSGCVKATNTASTSAVVAGEGRTGGTSGQSSSDDHTDEAGVFGFRPIDSPCQLPGRQPCCWYPPLSMLPLPIQTSGAPWKTSLLP